MINLIRLFSAFFVLSCTLIHSDVNAEEVSDLTGIYIKSNPSGADIYIDNVKVGKSSPDFQSMNLIPDQLITVTLKKRDYNTLTFKVQVHKGLNKFENIKLIPAFGYLTLTGTPADAKVSVDGKVIGTLGEISRFKLNSGRHLLTAEKEGMIPLLNRVIKIFDDEHSQADIVLKKSTAAPEKAPVTARTILSSEKIETDAEKKAAVPAAQKTAPHLTQAKEPTRPERPPTLSAFEKIKAFFKSKIHKSPEALPEKRPGSDNFKKAVPSSSPAKESNNLINGHVATSTKPLTDISEKNIVVINLPTGEGAKINSPELLNVTQGEYVLWKNKDKRFHYIVYKPEFSLYSSYGNAEEDDEEEEVDDVSKPLFSSPKLNDGDSWAYKFQKPGTYSYYCFIHPLEIVGQIVVSESGSIQKKAAGTSGKREDKTTKVDIEIKSIEKSAIKERTPAHPENNTPEIPDNHIVTITLPESDGSFINNPVTLKVRSGEYVLWKNEDKRFHYIAYKPKFTLYTSYGKEDEDEEEEEDTVKSLFTSPKLSTGDSWSYQFKTPGSYSYYCFLHPLEIVGEIIVE